MSMTPMSYLGMCPFANLCFNCLLTGVATSVWGTFGKCKASNWKVKCRCYNQIFLFMNLGVCVDSARFAQLSMFAIYTGRTPPSHKALFVKATEYCWLGNMCSDYISWFYKANIEGEYFWFSWMLAMVGVLNYSWVFANSLQQLLISSNSLQWVLSS